MVTIKNVSKKPVAEWTAKDWEPFDEAIARQMLQRQGGLSSTPTYAGEKKVILWEGNE